MVPGSQRLWLLCLGCILCIPAPAADNSATANVAVLVRAQCEIRDLRSSVAQQSGATISGWTQFSYLVRTSVGSGSGAVRMRLPGAADWSEIAVFGPDTRTSRTGVPMRIEWRLPVQAGAPGAGLMPEVTIECR
jgi:hypothetical protein